MDNKENLDYQKAWYENEEAKRKEDDFRKEAYHKGYLDALDYVAKEFSAIFDLTTKP